jgi:hypothetical protein
MPADSCFRCFTLLVAAACAALTPPASAHDTWFERLSPAGAHQVLLALGTGDAYPLFETGVGAEYLVQPGCRGAAGDAPLLPLRNGKTALVLRAPAGAQSCWLQLTPFDIELAPDKVALYLEELNASASLRATWAAMQARGLRWQERYTKFARIDMASGAAAVPAPMAMDALLQRQGAEWQFTLLRDGNPLPGLAVELRSAAQPTGTWYRTDEQGQVRVPARPAGRWLLRAIDLRLVGAAGDRWESRFLTLAFDGSSGSPAAPVALQR